MPNLSILEERIEVLEKKVTELERQLVDRPKAKTINEFFKELDSVNINAAKSAIGLNNSKDGL